MAKTISDMGKTKLTVKGVSAAGNPTTKFYGVPAWISTDPTIVTLTPIDAQNQYAESTGMLGTSKVRVQAFKDSSMTQVINGEIDITVEAGPAVVLQIDAAPEEPR